MSLPRFLVPPETIAGMRAVLTGAQLKHFRARRLRVGSKVVLADGMGQQRQGVVAAVERQQAVIQVTNEQPLQRESPLRFTLAQALLKSDKLDWVIEKATELGVTELIIFTSERSVARVTADRHARWTRLARSAVEQCQRNQLPRIAGPVPFDQLLLWPADALRLFFWEQESPGSLAAIYRHQPLASSLLAVIGPEGGFSVHEAERAAAVGFQMVGLAPRILRAETAALTAASLCQFLWGDLGTSAR